MSNKQHDVKINLEAEGISPEGAEQESEQEQENQSQLINARGQKGVNGSGTIKVTG